MTDRGSRWDRIIPVINSGSSFIVTGHEHADGDALGSQIALYYFLRQMGKRVRAINSDEPQKKLSFLDPAGVVKMYDPKRHLRDFDSCDAWIIVDTSARNRIGALGDAAREFKCKKIAIDHHTFVPEESFADINIVDDKAVATGKLIYQLACELGCRLDRLIAQALYAAIYTDSGGFVYSKMDAATHQITAELLKAGVVPYKIFDQLYQKHTAQEVKLFGRALNSLRFEYDGQVALMALTSRMYEHSGADPEASETVLLDYVRAIRTVELVVLLRQLPEGFVKVSLRSKNFFAVSEMARELGGGGHTFAAGAKVEGSLPSVYNKVKSLLAKEWRSYGKAVKSR